MMIGWDILNKDNSFSFFFKLFRPLRSFCLFVCPPFVSANLAPSIFFARPCPFFRRLWSCFPLRPPLLSPPLLHPQIFKLFPPCLPFSARAELLFSFSPRPHCSPPLFLRPFRPLRSLRPLRLPRLPRLPRPSLSRLCFPSARPLFSIRFAPFLCLPFFAPFPPRFVPFVPFSGPLRPHFLPRPAEDSARG